MATQRVPVRGVELGVRAWGAGEPIVFVQTALAADELVPLARTPALDQGYRRIVYHRRGYADSGGGDGPGSIAGDAADCRALMDELGVARAHLVGVSYSAAVALQLAADAPRAVHTLVLIEPPPVHVPSAAAFRAANDRLLASRRRAGAAAALDEFLSLVIGPLWRDVAERQIPGSVAQMARDAATFFDTDLPALLDWRFGPADARRVTCPVLHVGGTDSGPWFAEVRELVLAWFPHAEDVTIAGADHSLALTHSRQIGGAVARFLGHHPMDRGRS